MNWIQENARILATVVVSILSLAFPLTDFSEGMDFFEELFLMLSIPVGVGLTLLLDWIGDRVLANVNITPTLVTILGVVAGILAFVLGDMVAAPILEFLDIIVETGEIALGAAIGVLIKLFGDERIPLELRIKTVNMYSKG
jgi:hypothetical protein